MKKYSHIPLQERKRNADRVYRHEERLEEIIQRREMRELIAMKEGQSKQETDKDREEAEAMARNEIFGRMCGE